MTTERREKGRYFDSIIDPRFLLTVCVLSVGFCMNWAIQQSNIAANDASTKNNRKTIEKIKDYQQGLDLQFARYMERVDSLVGEIIEVKQDIKILNRYLARIVVEQKKEVEVL